MLLILFQSFLAQNWVFYTIIGTFALLIGSFCNVAIYRLPIMLNNLWREECLSFLEQTSPAVAPKIFNLFVPRSHCPKCRHIISLWQNIPILSYVILRGKCHNCCAKISYRYPLVEILSGVAALLVAYHFGVSGQMVFLLLLTWALIILVFIDFDHQLLPDAIIFMMLWLGLLVNIFGLFTTPKNAILGVLLGYGSLWLVAVTFKFMHEKENEQESIKYGDCKLLAMFGAWLGWQVLPLIILLIAILGFLAEGILILARQRRYSASMVFGPYLACAGWIMFFVDKEVYKHFLLMFV